MCARALRAQGEKVPEGRKEKSIRELSIKFVGLFMQAAQSSGAIDEDGNDGVLSLDQAARSLRVHQAAERTGGGGKNDASVGVAPASRLRTPAINGIFKVSGHRERRTRHTRGRPIQHVRHAARKNRR